MAAFLCLLVALTAAVCNTSAQTSLRNKPRLVVLISYDQYRGDYPDAFRTFVAKRGFERFRNEGAVFTQCLYQHANMLTGPGHATLMTGCNPNKTGIPANDFCDSESGHCVYCAEGTDGALSPENLLRPTFGDMLRERNPASKSVGIAVKDRAAIFMAGKNPTSVLWMDYKTHAFTTSTYYKTPSWLPKLNKMVRPEKHANATWSLRIPNAESPAVDDQVGEGTLSSGRRTFPYTIPAADNANFFTDYIRTPYNMYDLFEAAKAVIKYEKLGADAVPDVLCIGVSTTDYVGHTFGPDSREVQELYVECDEQLATFIDFLDKRIGRNRYVLVVSSDHGVAPIPEIIKNISEAQHTTVDAGRIREKDIRRTIDSALSSAFGAPSAEKSWCREILEPSIFFADEVLTERKATKKDVARVAANALRSLQGIGVSITRDDIESKKRPAEVPTDIWTYINNSYVASRCGDVFIYPKQYWIFGSGPATHGTPYEYDRHVPLMWLGGGVTTGTYDSDASPIDIAPTLAEMFGFAMPAGVDGRVLSTATPSKR